MYSLEFMKFLVGKDTNDYLPKAEKEVTKKSEIDAICNHKRYVTVPVEVQNK